MNPLTSLFMAGLFGAAIGAAGAGKVVADHYSAAATKRIGEAAAAYESRTQDLNDKSAELEGVKSGQRTVYKTIEKRVETYVDRPVYIRECLDTQGVEDVNSALSGLP
jgi:hypothetical protein